MDLRQLFITVQVKFSQFIVYNFFWINLTVFIVITGSVGYLVLFPQYRLYAIQKYNDLPALERQLGDIKSRIEIANKDQLDITRLKNNPELEKLLTIIPTKQEVADIFIQFDTIARYENFKIVNFSISEDLSRDNVRVPRDVPKNLHKIQIQASLTGSGYESLKRMIALLESNLRIMDINSLSFVPSTQGATLYNFIISTYYMEN